MNLGELIEQVKDTDPELAEKLRSLAPAGQSDLSKLNVVARFRLEKFDGDYEPGKQPFEVIEGGDGLPTVITNEQSDLSH